MAEATMEAEDWARDQAENQPSYKTEARNKEAADYWEDHIK